MGRTLFFMAFTRFLGLDLIVLAAFRGCDEHGLTNAHIGRIITHAGWSHNIAAVTKRTVAFEREGFLERVPCVSGQVRRKLTPKGKQMLNDFVFTLYALNEGT